MSEFIALRKTSRSSMLGLATASLGDIRWGLVEDAQGSERAEVLKGLGLEQIQPEERAYEAQYGFQRLGYVGAYVINAPDEGKTEQAKETLEPDYIFMRDIELSLPTPAIAAAHLLRRGSQRESWPEESGISTAHDNGATGEGVLVGVLDTGCDADHLELRRKHIEFRYVSPVSPRPSGMRAVRGFDVDGHGTHVCSIIAGQNVGVAPGVDLMVASVIESESLKTSLKRILTALDWMLSQFQIEENLEKPTIVSMSLGFRPDLVDAADLQAITDGIRLVLATMVDEFRVLPVIAIGNDGPGVVCAPACFPEALSVGAVDFDLNAAPFSGGGISPTSGQSEPDIAGYGVDVFAALERNAANRSWYARMSGSSMATPYVTGVAALCASTTPGLAGNILRQHIVQHALPLPEPPERIGVGLARFV